MAASAAWSQVELDSRSCLTLEQVLSAFLAPISEYHAWAIIHQAVKCLVHVLEATDIGSSKYMVVSSRDIVIHKEGFIHPDTFLQPGLDRKELTSEVKVLEELGMVVYEALDFTMPEESQRKLAKDLEFMLETMTDVDSGDEGDEGIEDCELGRDLMRKVEDLCRKNVEVESSADEHYSAVCRALVVEALEISSFMAKMRGSKDSSEELMELDLQDWSSIWQQLMHELRNGIQLKKVNYNYTKDATEYEFTPYELLMDDIRTKKYKLNPVDIPPKVQKDAKNEILEFIRSRPPLKSASLRVLKPKQISQSPAEKLMEDIRSGSARKSLRKAKTNVSEVKEISNRARIVSERKVIDLDDEIVSDLLNFDMDDVSICDISVFSSNVEMIDLDITPTKAQYVDTTPTKAQPHYMDTTPTKAQPHYMDTTPTKAQPSPRALIKSISDVNLVRPSLNRSLTPMWNQGLKSSLLTFQEFCQIIVKMDDASLDGVATLAVKEDLIKGKICFRCKTSRFGIFTWSTECFACGRLICSKCLTSIVTPTSDSRDIPLVAFVSASSANCSPCKDKSRQGCHQKCNGGVLHTSPPAQSTQRFVNTKSASGKGNRSAEKNKVNSGPKLVPPSFKRSKTMSKAETRKSKMKLSLNCGIKQRVCNACLDMMTNAVAKEQFCLRCDCSQVKEHLI